MNATSDGGEDEIVTSVGDFGAASEGYIVTIPLPAHAVEAVEKIQQTIAAQLPADSLWLPQSEQLHVTFAHIVSPDSSYTKGRRNIYERVESDVLNSIKRVSAFLEGNQLAFDEIRASPDAIILVASDNGTTARARRIFIQGFELPPESRQPPKLIHSTIARYKKPLPLKEVEAVARGLQPHITFTTPALELVQEHSTYLQSHTVLGRFSGGREVLAAQPPR